MNTLNAFWVIGAVTVALAGAAHGGTLYTPPVFTSSGGSLSCQAVNVSSTMRAVDLTIVDSTGAGIVVADCFFLEPGATCTLGGVSAAIGTAPHHCRVEVFGNNRLVRGSLIGFSAGGSPQVAVPAQ